MKIPGCEEPHLAWTPASSEKRWFACNQTGELLGWLDLERVGRHMHWCWHQHDQEISMSPGCLDEVRKKQKELFKNRKS